MVSTATFLFVYLPRPSRQYRRAGFSTVVCGVDGVPLASWTLGTPIFLSSFLLPELHGWIIVASGGYRYQESLEPQYRGPFFSSTSFFTPWSCREKVLVLFFSGGGHDGVGLFTPCLVSSFRSPYVFLCHFLLVFVSFSNSYSFFSFSSWRLYPFLYVPSSTWIGQEDLPALVVEEADEGLVPPRVDEASF